MARFNKMQVLEAIGKTGMVPVFYHAGLTDGLQNLHFIEASHNF